MTQYSQFPDGNQIRVGDQVVGLRSGANYRFNFPSDGIQDVNGAYIFKYSPIASGVNYVVLSNNITGSAPVIQSMGSDTDVGLVIKTQGVGAVSIPDDVIDLTSLQVDNLQLNANAITSKDIGGNIEITPDTTGDLVLDGVNWPQADGAANEVLTTDGAAQTSWTDIDTILNGDILTKVFMTMGA